LTSDTRRLFFALWPDDAVRSRLEVLTADLSVAGRAIAGRNLHLTLAFLGSVNEVTQRCVEQAARTLPAHSFDLVLDEVGWFRRPRVLWVGASRTPEALAELVARLNESLAGCGFAPETRPFRAHVTLARKVGRGPPKPEPISPIAWPVSALVLVESMVASTGAEYHPLARWPMA
jgi:RNA 2',3'-cyclic 3'-phosphodiesterase